MTWAKTTTTTTIHWSNNTRQLRRAEQNKTTQNGSEQSRLLGEPQSHSHSLSLAVSLSLTITVTVTHTDTMPSFLESSFSQLSAVLNGELPLTSTPVLISSVLVLLLAGLVSFVVTKTVGNKHDKTKYATPWPKVDGALPFIGNLHQLKDLKFISTKTKEWADQYSKDHGCYQMDLMGDRWIVVCRQDRMKEIMLKRPFKVLRSKKSTATAVSVGANGVFATEGDEWQKNRRLVAPLFNANHTRDYLQNTKTIAARLIDKWTAHVNSEATVDGFGINDDFFKYMMDVTAYSALGRDLGMLQNANALASTILDVMEGTLLRTLSPFSYWEIPFIGQYLDGVGFAVNRLMKHMNEIIDDHQRTNKESKTGKTATSLVGKMVQQGKEDPEFDRDLIIGNLVTVFFAGTDSTATTHSTAIQYLIEDETGLQEELAKEVRTKLPANMNDITLQDLSEENIPLLRSFLQESSRCCPSFPILLYETAVDIPFCGTTLPKGSNIMAMLEYVSINPHTAPTHVPTGPNGEYPDHTAFHPRRWLVHNNDKSTTNEYDCKLPEVNSMSYLSFGHGRRQCLARQFAEATVAFTIAAILQSFVVDKAPNYESPGREQKFSNTPNKDIRIRLTVRQ